MPNITVRRRLIKGLIAVAAIPVVALMSKKSLAAPENPSHKPVGSLPSVLTPKGWTWNEPHGFVWGRVAPPASHTIYVSGQSSVDGGGNILHKGDMGAQLEKSLDNLEVILAEAGATLANVVSVTYYTVDIEQFFAAMETLTTRMEKQGASQHQHC